MGVLAMPVTLVSQMEGRYDLYRFPLLGLSEAELATREECAQRLGSQVSKWAKAAVWWQPSNGIPPPKGLKQLARQGIPPSLRPSLWLQLSGGLARKKAASVDYYQRLVQMEQSVTPRQADLEPFRSFPSHPQLASPKGTEAVRRVVLAYARHNPAAEYPHSMSCIVGYSLAVLGFEKEEDVFWIVTALLEDRLFTSWFSQDKHGCRVEQQVLSALLEKKCPRIVALLDRLECPISSLTCGWFSCLFTKALPAETTARVWDTLFVEGPKVLFRFALALFKMHETALLSTAHGMQIGRITSWRVARTYKADALCKMAFHGIGSLSMTSINRTRQDKETVVRQELAEQKRRLNAVLCSAAQPEHAARGSPTAQGLDSISEDDESLA